MSATTQNNNLAIVSSSLSPDVPSCSFCAKTNATSRCSRCKTPYCNAECQKQGWSCHKRYCSDKSLESLLEYMNDKTVIIRSQSINAIVQNWDELSHLGVKKMIEKARKTKFIFDKDNRLPRDPRQGMTLPEFKLPESGCQTALSIIAVLATNNDKINSHVMALNLLLRDGLDKPPKHQPGIIFGFDISTSFKMGEPVDSARFLKCENLDFITRPKPDVHDTDVYVFRLIPDNILSPDERIAGHDPMTLLMSLMGGDNSSQYTVQTFGPPRSEHFIVLVRKGDEYSLFQSFYMNYTYEQWCDFDKPLKKFEIDEKLGVNPEWRFNLAPSPYRKIMCGCEVKEFASDLFSLTREGDHVETFARITSIVFKNRDIGRSYNIAFGRCRINNVTLSE